MIRHSIISGAPAYEELTEGGQRIRLMLAGEPVVVLDLGLTTAAHAYAALGRALQAARDMADARAAEQRRCLDVAR